MVGVSLRQVGPLGKVTLEGQAHVLAPILATLWEESSFLRLQEKVLGSDLVEQEPNPEPIVASLKPGDGRPPKPQGRRAGTLMGRSRA